MQAAIADIYTGLVSQVSDASELAELPDNQRWLTDADWVAAPTVGQIWQSNLPATFIDAVPIVPDVVTMRQARLALLGAGLLSQVNAIIAAMPEPQQSETMIWWDYSTEVHRDSPIVAQLGAALGLSDAQIDTLFVSAAVL